jgi:Na+-transporting methylmalonyl-CoA/oxaloacetate decarboxylase gamma subunit
MRELIFFGLLGAFAFFIFLLSLVLVAVDSYNPHDTRDAADNENNPNHDQVKTDNERLASIIADAIHTYRRHRTANERDRTQREKITI